MDIEIIDYRPELQPMFEQLNKAWLEEYFRVEVIDEWVLGNPEEAILNGGGRILFAKAGEKIIGTVAVRRLETGEFELTKMAVDKRYQGYGAGKMLCQAAIALVQELGADRIMLYSQTGLKAAIGIYRKLGFVEIPLEHGLYERADIKMEKWLDGSALRAM
jgi:ribosomal protein S18 acetylase RimI-like enzyme